MFPTFPRIEVSIYKEEIVVDIQGWGIPPNGYMVGDVEMQVPSSSFLRCCLVGERIAIALFGFRAKHQFLLIPICCMVVW